MCTALDAITPLLKVVEAELATELSGVCSEHASTTSSLRRGIAAEEILFEAQDRGADLVVVGTHGRAGVMAHLLMGSVAERLVRTSPIAILTVRFWTGHCVTGPQVPNGDQRP